MSQWRFHRFWPQLLKSGAAGWAGGWRGESVHRAVIHTAGLSVGGEEAGARAPHCPVFHGWEAGETVREAKKGQSEEWKESRELSTGQVRGSGKKTDPWMWHLRSRVTSVRELLMGC